MKELYTTEERLKIILIIAIIDQLGSTLDQLFWTPFRDVQALAQQSYNSISGPNHSILTGFLLSTSLLANLGFIAKVFNKNETNTLQEVLENSRDELGHDYLEADGRLSEEQKIALQKYFNNDLHNKGHTHLKVNIENTKAGYDLRYSLSTDLINTIRNNAALTFNKIDSLNLDEASKTFLKNLFPENARDGKKTLADVRKEYGEKLYRINPSDVTNTVGSMAVDVSFQYWLAWFVSDMTNDNADSTKWDIKTQFITIGIAFSITFIKFAAKARDFFKQKKEDEARDLELDAETSTKSDLEHADNSLKHQQLSSFFMRILHLRQSLSRHAKPYTPKNLTEKQKARRAKWKKIKNFFFARPSDANEMDEIIKKEIEQVEIKRVKISLSDTSEPSIYSPADLVSVTPSAANIEVVSETKTEMADVKSFSQRLLSINVAAALAITGSFMEWVGSAIISAFSQIGNAANNNVTGFFNGLGGGLLGLGTFLLGAIVGVRHYNRIVKPELQAKRQKLREQYKSNEVKVDYLKVLAGKNKNLRNEHPDLLKPIPVIKAHDIRGLRRLTTQKTPVYTTAKKSLNRFNVFMDKSGSFILLLRLVPLAILGLASVSLLGPAGIAIAAVTLTLGLIWGAIHVYKYIQDRRLANAQYFLDNIDVLIENEENTRKTYEAALRNQPASNPTYAKIQASLAGENFLPTRKPEELGIKEKVREPLPEITTKSLLFFNPASRRNDDLVAQGMMDRSCPPLLSSAC